MFTAIAFFSIAIIGWYVGRANDKERHHLNAIVSDDEARNCVLHTRQDLKLVCFLLGGILIMLGIVADRLH
jgi:hypothetical protein